MMKKKSILIFMEKGLSESLSMGRNNLWPNILEAIGSFYQSSLYTWVVTLSKSSSKALIELMELACILSLTKLMGTNISGLNSSTSIVIESFHVLTNAISNVACSSLHSSLKSGSLTRTLLNRTALLAATSISRIRFNFTGRLKHLRAATQKMKAAD
jgi:hypothetical protein